MSDIRGPAGPVEEQSTRALRRGQSTVLSFQSVLSQPEPDADLHAEGDDPSDTCVTERMEIFAGVPCSTDFDGGASAVDDGEPTAPFLLSRPVSTPPPRATGWPRIRSPELEVFGTVCGHHDRIARKLSELADEGAPPIERVLDAIEEIVGHLAGHRAGGPAMLLLSADANRLDGRMRLLALRLAALCRLGSTRLAQPLAELRDAYREHVVVEEEYVLPDLIARLEPEALASLDHLMDVAQARARTDQHPVVSSASVLHEPHPAGGERLNR
jgi:hypothetical protein